MSTRAWGFTIWAVLACGAHLQASSAQPTVSATVSQLAWLAGTWSTSSPPGSGPTIEERWTPPAGGAMLAVSRTIEGDRLTGFEFLRIVERDGTLVYIAQPGGRPPTEFRLTRLSSDDATFENPAHDFPKVIHYRRLSNGTIEARVSDGTDARVEVYRFARKP